MLAVVIFLLVSGGVQITAGAVVENEGGWISLFVVKIMPVFFGLGNLIVAGFLYLTFVAAK